MTAATTTHERFIEHTEKKKHTHTHIKKKKKDKRKKRKERNCNDKDVRSHFLFPLRLLRLHTYTHTHTQPITKLFSLLRCSFCGPAAPWYEPGSLRTPLTPLPVRRHSRPSSHAPRCRRYRRRQLCARVAA